MAPETPDNLMLPKLKTKEETMLSKRDIQLINEFDQLLQPVRCNTRGVAEGWHTGFYLWGEGGISKSFTVIQELDQMEANYKITNRVTGKGLFDLLAEYPDIVHVLEDCERLCSDPNASTILRSALWSSKRKTAKQHIERLISWQTSFGREEAIFTGGIIFTMNAALDNYPDLRAIKTRIAHLHLQPSNEQIAAKMREIASKGHLHGKSELPPEECMEVCNYVIDRLNEFGKNYDFRVLVNAFQYRLQEEAGHSKTSWRELVDIRIKERLQRVVSRDEQMSQDRKIALEISDRKDLSNDQKLQLWTQKTGKGKSAYYDRLKGK